MPAMCSGCEGCCACFACFHGGLCRRGHTPGLHILLTSDWCMLMESRLYAVSVVLTTVCTWLLWACCYMSQMYPIL